MKQIGTGFVLKFLMLIFCVLLLCSCATTRPPIEKNLLEQGIEIKGRAKLPDQVIVYRETDVGGFTVEYGVLRLKGTNDNNLVLEYVDPAELLFLGPRDILVYFKTDVSNPTGKQLFVTHELTVNEQSSSNSYHGGNAPHTTYYFYVRIPREGERVKSKIILRLEDAHSFVETHQLTCAYRQKENQEGGD